MPLNLVQDMETTNKEFFYQSIDEKNKVKRDEANDMGYSELTQNVRNCVTTILV